MRAFQTMASKDAALSNLIMHLYAPRARSARVKSPLQTSKLDKWFIDEDESVRAILVNALDTVTVTAAAELVKVVSDMTEHLQVPGGLISVNSSRNHVFWSRM